MDRHLEAALKLHQYLLDKHWNGKAIAGPDPIGRINWRVTRFIKSYTRWLQWKDDLAYLQGQSYWIKANLNLFELRGHSDYLNIAGQCADYIVQRQLPNGAWEHPPIRGRQGFISAVESVWACLGLISAYRSLGKRTYLEATARGYDALVHVIGFRRFKDSLAINYHAHTKEMVPNATTMLLWLLAEIYEVTGDEQYLRNAGGMLRFLYYAQMESGELQYIYNLRPHFQCYQYNSFQFLDLAHYYRLTGDERARQILSKLVVYLATGQTLSGRSRYSCFKEVPEVNYWTLALASALREAHDLGLGDYLSASERGCRYLLTRQRPDGGFDFSAYTYGLLQDRCSYPRYLAMILYHLLCRTRVTSHETAVAAHSSGQ